MSTAASLTLEHCLAESSWLSTSVRIVGEQGWLRQQVK